jgi:hypothetical protein
MGGCENERADFNQKADHLFLPSEFGDSRPISNLFFVHGHAPSQFPRASTRQTPDTHKLNSFRCRQFPKQ